MKKMYFICFAILLSCVTACTALENYKFGDLTRTTLETANKVVLLKQEYCSDINAPAREVLLNLIRLVDPDYDGVCNAVEREISPSGEDKRTGTERSTDGDESIHGFGQHKDSGSGERMRLGIVEIRLCAGDHVWPEGNHGLLHTRYGLHIGDNIKRESGGGHPFFDEFGGVDQHAGRYHQHHTETLSETSRPFIL